VNDHTTPARDRLFALIASIPGSGSVEWCGPARELLDEIEAASAVRPPATDRTAKAEALLLHFTAEAHRRKWSYDRGLDDDGVPIKSEAFDALHRLGEEMRVALEKLRSAAESAAPGPDRTLAAALDGLHTLIATSSRDWQTYRVDAWLWAVLCGWDCEQTEHDDTCTHGALEETAVMHGWDADTIAKARRYRAAVRALTAPAVGGAQQPDRIVAYRLPASRDLHCLACCAPPRGDIWTPVTAEELEDGGGCTTCGVDVLIEQQPKEA